MCEHDKTWFNSFEEKQTAIEKATRILESAGMHREGIAHFMRNDELIWSVCNEPEVALNWNSTCHFSNQLNTQYGYVDLVNYYLEMS